MASHIGWLVPNWYPYSSYYLMSFLDVFCDGGVTDTLREVLLLTNGFLNTPTPQRF